MICFSFTASCYRLSISLEQICHNMLTIPACFLKKKLRFMYIIRSDAGQPLRDELAKSPQKILSYAFPEILPKPDTTMGTAASTPPATSCGDDNLISVKSESSNAASTKANLASDAYFQGLYLIKTMVKLIPSWLQSNRSVFDTLVLIWKSPARISRLQNEQELNLVQVVSSTRPLIIFDFAPCLKLKLCSLLLFLKI